MKMYTIDLVVFNAETEIAYVAKDRDGKELVSGTAKTIEIALESVRKVLCECAATV